MRDKWLRDDYRGKTIAYACQATAEVWEPRRNGPPEMAYVPAAERDQLLEPPPEPPPRAPYAKESFTEPLAWNNPGGSSLEPGQ